MAGQKSPSLPAALQPFLDFVRTRDIKMGGTGDNAQRALEGLCEEGKKANRGFDPKTLAFHLNFFVIHLKAAKAPGPVWGPLRYGNATGERFKLRDLQRLAVQAQKLREKVRKLKRTNLIFQAYIAGQISPGDVLSLQFTNDDHYIDEVPALDALVKLPAIARWHKSAILHETDASLWRLCRYVNEKTGSWNDKLVVDVLQPLRISHAQTVPALKQWRSNLRKR